MNYETVLAAIEGAMKRLDHHIETAILSGEDERADVQALLDLATAKGEHLSDAVADLVVSLGWKAHRQTRIARLYGKDCGLSFKVTFRPTEQVFHLKRKAEKLNFAISQQNRHLQRMITSVVPVDSVPVRCIAVDSPSHLFLAGRACVPTHNTYTGAVLVEEFIKAGAPVVVLDPVGAWWGLRSSADGQSAGLPVVILGGEHGDVPLEEKGGKIIADLVVDDPRPLILDLSGFESNAAQDRFVCDFAEHLYRRKAQNRAPLHLMFDEADSFAPQKPMPGQQRMLGAIEALVRRGRQRGIGATFITQRPAVLNKNVLTQIEVLIVLQITAPQDRAAIEDWVRGHGTREQCDQLLASLASLQKGQAWFWSPSRFDLFEQVQVRTRETFDSGATPKLGDKVIAPRELAPVDLEALRARLAATIEETQNNDPAALHAQVAELQKQLKDQPSAGKETPVVAASALTHLENQAHALIESSNGLRDLGMDILGRVASLRAPVAPESAPKPNAPKRAEFKLLTPPVACGVAPNPPAPKPSAAKTPRSPRRASAFWMLWPRSRPLGCAMSLAPTSRCGRAWRPSPAATATTWARCAPRVSSTIPRPTRVQLTGAGRAASKAPAQILTLRDLHGAWCQRLPRPQAILLSKLVTVYPRSISKADLAEFANQSPKSSGFTNNLGALRTMGCSIIPSPGKSSRRSCFSRRV